MKRFVDLGHQLGLDDTWPRQFAFYCTVVDRFEYFNCNQVWRNWKAFEEDCPSDKLERFRSLCPDWVFTAKDWGDDEDE